jgi:hypothetical protein
MENTAANDEKRELDQLFRDLVHQMRQLKPYSRDGDAGTRRALMRGASHGLPMTGMEKVIPQLPIIERL